MDYKKTLTLPRTDFSMKANLPKREVEIQKTWEEMNLYRQCLEKQASEGTFILHDGPPYSNEHIHLGTSLNRILKDFVLRYKVMKGYTVPFIPGWDNHGMPIEREVSKRLKIEGKQASRLEIRRKCREYAEKFVQIQKEEFNRLGLYGDWENPYLTMSSRFEGKILEVFGELVEKGYIYRGLRPIHWCPFCETTLAEAEIEYQEKESISIWVRFPLRKDPKKIFGPIRAKEKFYALIWTTTPWTIPGNLAIALHPEFTYVLWKDGENHYLLALDLLELVQKELNKGKGEILRTMKGKELDGIVFGHPLYDRDSPILFGEHVTLEQGTGCVHTAPGHGAEDFWIGKKYGIEPLCLVDGKGRFTEEAEGFAGLDLEKGNEAVLEALNQKGALLKRGTLTHSYPHCWRCKNPLIFRTTEQWFMNVDHENHRKKALKAIEEVKWYPEESRNRIRGAVESRPDWCLSRQRAWGVGIPALLCLGCKETILSKKVIDRVAQMVKEKGSDVWFELEAKEFLPPHFTCPKCGGSEFEKETDILDVWFDSGSSHRVVLNDGKGAFRAPTWPADLYLEGSDQHRGWFNASLMIAIGTKGKPPYRNVITHGFTLDAKGKAMSKSLGNTIPPFHVIDRSGADVLRLWVASIDYFKDVRLSDEILERIEDSYRKIRNTFRFLLGNLRNFHPEQDSVPVEKMMEIDRWMLMRLQEVIQGVQEGYETYEFHRGYNLIYPFCAIDLSAFYLDVLKDRLYTWGKNSQGRRSAQTTLYQLVTTLARLLAPLLPHTMEEVWQHLPNAEGETPHSALRTPNSVHLAEFPPVEESLLNQNLKSRWEKLIEIREEVLSALEIARKEDRIGSSLEAKVLLQTQLKERRDLLEGYLKDLPTLFITSQVNLLSENETDLEIRSPKLSDLSISIQQADGKKCQRCWIYSTSVGESERYPDVCSKCLQVLQEG
ncbi:isoleucine--tRNA ligase [candidate division TA06 bacterium]|nr:isoleucine--tRNA ligase [candidate division TA06 bacterium]